MNAAVLDKPRIRTSFAAAAATYDRAAALQRLSAAELMHQAEKEDIRGTVLDLGCGTGHLAELLLSAPHPPNTVIALDIAAGMIEAARSKLHRRFDPDRLHYICADAERLPFADNTLDGICSNLALQWCNPLERVLVDLKRILKPGRPLIFSTFGPQTLHELKAAWAEADDLPHVNDFHGEQELAHFLLSAGFGACRVQRTLHKPRYASVTDLMHELKQIGAHNAHVERPRSLTGKSKMRTLCEAYERYRVDGLIPATFEILLVTARA